METCETKRVQESKTTTRSHVQHTPSPHLCVPTPPSLFFALLLLYEYSWWIECRSLFFLVAHESVHRLLIRELPASLCFQLQPNPKIPPYIFLQSVQHWEPSAASRPVTQSSQVQIVSRNGHFILRFQVTLAWRICRDHEQSLIRYMDTGHCLAVTPHFCLRKQGCHIALTIFFTCSPSHPCNSMFPPQALPDFAVANSRWVNSDSTVVPALFHLPESYLECFSLTHPQFSQFSYRLLALHPPLYSLQHSSTNPVNLPSLASLHQYSAKGGEGPSSWNKICPEHRVTWDTSRCFWREQPVTRCNESGPFLKHGHAAHRTSRRATAGRTTAACEPSTSSSSTNLSVDSAKPTAFSDSRLADHATYSAESKQCFPNVRCPIILPHHHVWLFTAFLRCDSLNLTWVSMMPSRSQSNSNKRHFKILPTGYAILSSVLLRYN